MSEEERNDLIQELKNKIGYSAKSSIINSFGLEQKGIRYKCPNKSKHKHGDNNPSMSWDNEKNHFYCFTCKYILDIYNYYTEIQGKGFREIMIENGLLDNNEPNKPINKIEPKIELSELNDMQLNYIKNRKINLDILENFNIANHNGKIAFVYKAGNKILGVKLRHSGKTEKGKRFSAVKGSSDKNFWNQKDFENKDILYITEGEFDCICLYQCGYTNVVSIPDGAGQSAKVIDREIEYLKQYKSIVVISDNDDAGNDMDRIFIDKLGEKIRIIDKSLMENGSDINQEYFKHGKQAINKLINSATIKINGYRDVTVEPYRGLKNSGVKFIPTGIESLDDCINELESKRLTVINGRTGEGKTTFIEQIQNNAIDKGYPVLRVDGEHSQEHILNNTYRKLISNVKDSYNLVAFGRKYIKEPKEKTLETLNRWHNNKLYLFTKSDTDINNNRELFKKIKYMVNVNKISLVILDNLMSLINTTSLEKNEIQSEFVQMCHDLSVNYNIHIILVVHPNKSHTKGQSDIDSYQISGSSDIANKADTIINISREYDDEKLRQNIHGSIHVLKNRGYGELIKINTFYDKESSMLNEIIDNEISTKIINWRRFSCEQVNISDDILNIDNEKCPF